MLPKFVCNLASTVSSPPWRYTLDWDLHTTMQWEKRTPFHLCVQPNASRAEERTDLLARFSTLPAELQAYILAFCSASTLFQLMRVSSSLRREASKLFWTDPIRFFLVKADWLLHGGYPGHTCCDLAFLSHVRQVELEFLPGNDDTICPQEDGAASVRQDLIDTFWRSFKQRLPKATRVVINQNWTTPPWWQDTHPVAQPVRLLIQSCPPGLDVAVLTLEEVPLATNTGLMPAHQRWRRSLYRATACGRWATDPLERHWVTVLVPVKQMKGPVGEFKALRHRAERNLLKRNALWPLIIEAIDRYHFGGANNDNFLCPFPCCSAGFVRAGEWTAHAMVWHAQEWRTGKQMDILPDGLRAAFAGRALVIKKELEQIERQCRELSTDWNSDDGQRRREIEQSWMFQLEHDEAWETGQKARESRLWAELLEQVEPH